ncbi:MAG: hypothetical protein K6G26_10135 [Lachnospiraceae bacterium]|nr:hypothetical protein [Lachnospiraceae bacterium]
MKKVCFKLAGLALLSLTVTACNNDFVQNVKESVTVTEAPELTDVPEDITEDKTEIILDGKYKNLSDMITEDIKDNSSIYSSDEVINTIMGYEDVIEEAAKEVKMPKEFITAILLKEMSMIDRVDEIGDGMVEDYYNKLEQNGTAEGKNDSSTGLGQIFAKTAMDSHNTLVNKGIISGDILGDDIATKKSVWYSLKEDDEYNILFVAKTLRAKAVYSGISDFDNCSDDTLVKLFAAYNGSGSAATEYGQCVLKYYKELIVL